MKVHLLCLALLAVPAADAASTTFWLHNNSGGSWFDLDGDNPDATGKYQYVGNFAGFPQGEPAAMEATVTGMVMPDNLELRAGEKILLTTWIGSDAGWLAVWGRLTVSHTLYADSDVIATAPDTVVVLGPSATASWTKMEWAVDPAVTMIPAGATLSWKMRAEGQASDFAISASKPRGGISHFILPGEFPSLEELPQAPAIEYIQLNGSQIDLDLGSAEARDGTVQYNWTNLGTQIGWNLTGNASAGQATIAFMDGAGEVWNQTVDGDTTLAEIGTVAPGNWTITVRYTGYVGGLNLGMAPPPEESVPASPGAPPSNPQTNEAGTPESGESTQDAPVDEESPGIGLLALMAMIGLAARRRRQ